jgi:hypothetical protein
LEKEKETISRVEKLLKEGQFAEAHRLIFSLEMRSFLKKANKSELVSKEVEMLKKGHVAVNCGSSDYYLAPGGKVFFPDQKFENGLKYGYVGINSKKAVRDIVGLKENKAPELFRTEIYDLDGYKLTVPNGMYKLRLYMRYGYKPNYKPGAAVFSVKAQGKTLFEKLDFYKANGGDFYKPVILEFDNIHVTDNLLNVDFITVPDDTTKWESTARHVVGIEAIKQ